MEIYQTNGTCSRQIEFEVENNILTHLKFFGGCLGNTTGIIKLAVGMNIDDLIEKLQGVICRNGTSCPDQLAKALIKYKQTH